VSLVDEVGNAFAVNGVLAGKIQNFIPRAGQTDMAVAVGHAIEEASQLVVEAGTGVGKTYAYLVPALLSGERVLLSTATKTLQDQLFGRDLPELVEILGLPVSRALLKGRGSYLCLHRMQMVRHQPRLPEGVSLRALSKLEQWAQKTRAGDLAELAGLDERSPLIPWVTSTRENCLGVPCPSFRDCHVNLARREAMAADVVVVNHHLFFADLAVRESGVAELLPSVRIAIFDEAHQINEIGIQFLSVALTTGQILDLARDLLASGLQLARGLVDWHLVASCVELAARELRMCVASQPQGGKIGWSGVSPDGIDYAGWRCALQQVADACSGACEALATVSEIAPDFDRLHERAARQADRARQFMAPEDFGCVRWLEVGLQLRLVESPLNISHAVRTQMLGNAAGGPKTWIFTSATLGDNESLSWFTQPCGLDQAKILKVGSPFVYEKQAALYVPQHLPKPGDPSHSEKLAHAAAVWIRQLGGRTLVLTTTLRALRVIGDCLRDIFSDMQLDIDVLVQGSMPKRLLIDRFRHGQGEANRACVLVASGSFWEGIDVPGDALQMVIIDKLPFLPVTDPIAAARSKLIEAHGGNAFNEYFLPEAAVALKQGAGRLIRRETDQGVLVVADSRLASMGYGKRLLKALPPMQRLGSEAEFLSYLESLTKTCTTGSPQT
jgi:ATP-dependent DNA helicase DinG